MLHPNEVIDELANGQARLEVETEQLAEALQEHAEAKHAFKLAMARARLDSPGKSVQVREDESLILNDEAYKTFLFAEAKMDATRERVRSIRDQLSTIQSINASVRVQSTDGSY